MKDYLSYSVEDFVSDESYLRYYYNENEDDIRFWTNWISQHPNMLDVIVSANNYIDAFSIRLSDEEFQKEKQRFSDALNRLSEEFPPVHSISRKNEPAIKEETEGISVVPPQSIRRKVIAFCLALIVLTGGYYSVVHYNIFQMLTSAPEQVVMMEKYVPKGERAKVILPDGTEVHLNADSRLVYPSKFTGNEREVQLSGEAFFHVKRDTMNPFHIISGSLMTTVLGTSFNVKSYPTNDQIKVALVTGKVKLDRLADAINKKVIGETLILTPSEMGVFNKRSLALAKRKYDRDEELGWEIGVVVFKNADFSEIAENIQRTYNISLINASKKKEWSFTGTFNNLSAEDVVKSICLSKKLTYMMKGDSIVIQ